MTSETALNIANTSIFNPVKSMSAISGDKTHNRRLQGSSGNVIQLNRQNDASAGKTENSDQKAAGNNLDIIKYIRDEFDLINNVELKFDRDQETDEAYIKIVDKDSGDIVREIPPETLRKLAEKIDDMVGILFDQKA